MAIRILISLLILLVAGYGVTLWKAGRAEARAERRWPPVGKVVEVDGHPVHYVEAGDGPPLVLIHGASGNLRDWTFDAVARLSDRYRVIAFDRPGLGRTPALSEDGDSLADQAALLSAAAARLGAEAPILVGQSYGGGVALAWAVHHPDALSGLVLLAAVSRPWDTGISTFYKVTSGPLGRAVIPLITAWVPERIVTASVEDVFTPQSAPEGYAEHIAPGLTLRRATLRANALQRAGLLAEIVAQQPLYPSIRVPTEILHGDADTIVSHAVHSVPLAREIPGAALTILPGIGHMPQHVAIAEMDAAIDRVAASAGLR
ncbi:alpha/beta fold hydrolase [Salipiger sp.]|uniref:alpha/beta fold hydrolase n=1 Tax=Salipiger sp. TaxID=2078585 RepID=UPI003A9714E4